jgi:hypothetical protein
MSKPRLGTGRIPFALSVSADALLFGIPLHGRSRRTDLTHAAHAAVLAGPTRAAALTNTRSADLATRGRSASLANVRIAALRGAGRSGGLGHAAHAASLASRGRSATLAGGRDADVTSRGRNADLTGEEG